MSDVLRFLGEVWLEVVCDVCLLLDHGKPGCDGQPGGCVKQLGFHQAGPGFDIAGFDQLQVSDALDVGGVGLLCFPSPLDG